MRRFAPLLVLLLLAFPAQAETVFLTSGWDLRRGYFEGRITVDDHPDERDALLVVRVRTFEDASSERLQGRGRRSGNWVRAVLPRSAGAAGAIAGQATAPPTVMQIKQERDSGVWTESFTDGERTSLSRGLPEASARPTPTLPEGTSRAQVEHAGDADFVELDLDTDLEPSLEDSPAERFERFPSVLFVKGEGDAHAVAPNDVAQGRLGNCYLLAALIATARTDPEAIVSMIETNQDGSYTVTLQGLGPFGRGAAVRVSASVPVDASGKASFVGLGDSEVREGQEVREIWPSVIEKAWAKYKGSYRKTGDFYSATAFSFIGGKAEGFDPRDMSDAEILAVLQRAEREGNPMTLGTDSPKNMSRRSQNAMKRLNLYGYHAYALMGLEGERVRLYNPWGKGHPVRAVKIKEIRRLFASMSLGRY